MPSQIYSATMVMTLYKKLFGKEELQRLMNMDGGQEIKFLHEKGYGGANAASDDLEELLEGELIACKELICGLTEDKKATNAFFMRSDVQNIELLVKLRYQGKDLTTAKLDMKGTIEPRLLVLMVKEWDFSGLPEVFAKALAEIDEAFARERNPQVVSIVLDRAYFTYVMNELLSEKDVLLKEYFGTMCDYVNLICAVRMKGYELSQKAFTDMLMPTYEIDTKMLTEQFFKGDIEISMLARNVSLEKSRLYKAAFAGGVTAAKLEKAKETSLMRIAEKGKNDSFSVLPLIYYYLAKQREVQNIRLIITLHKNGTPNGEIEERLGVS